MTRDYFFLYISYIKKKLGKIEIDRRKLMGYPQPSSIKTNMECSSSTKCWLTSYLRCLKYSQAPS